MLIVTNHWERSDPADRKLRRSDWVHFEKRAAEFMAFQLVMDAWLWAEVKVIGWERLRAEREREHAERQARQRRIQAIALRVELYRARFPALSALACEQAAARDLGLSVMEVGLAVQDYRWLREAV
jgi:hypothetical protein